MSNLSYDLSEEFSCIYGSQHTPDTLYFYNGWYVIDGSVNVNYTNDPIFDGVDVEKLNDSDFFTAPEPVTNLDQLIDLVIN